MQAYIQQIQFIFNWYNFQACCLTGYRDIAPGIITFGTNLVYATLLWQKLHNVMKFAKPRLWCMHSYILHYITPRRKRHVITHGSSHTLRGVSFLKIYLNSKTRLKRLLSKDKKKVFKIVYRLRQAKHIITECSKRSLLQYVRPSLSYHLYVSLLFCLFFE